LNVYIFLKDLHFIKLNLVSKTYINFYKKTKTHFLNKSVFVNEFKYNFYKNINSNVLNYKMLHYNYYFGLVNKVSSNNYSYINLNLFFYKNLKLFTFFFHDFILKGGNFLIFEKECTFSENINIFVNKSYIKSQAFNVKYLFNQKKFFKTNNIRLLIFFDFSYFSKSIVYFNKLSIYTFAIIPVNYYNQYLDFYAFQLSNNYLLNKFIYFSYIYSIYIFTIKYKITFQKNNFIVLYQLFNSTMLK
jgi:hypothetical protein